MQSAIPQSRRALLPMTAMSAVAWLSGLLANDFSSRPMYLISLALLACDRGVMLSVAGRQPQWLLRASPYCYLVAATLLILSQADPHSGLSIILLLPVLAVAVRGTRTDSAAVVAAMILALLAIQLEHGAAGVVMVRVLLLWATFGLALSATLHTLRDGLASAHSALEAQAMADPLTGVANRRGLEAAIRLARGRHSSAFICLDVDGLKALNDTEGHDAGDALLVGVAHACQRVARPCDVVARLGGDEFAVFIPEADESVASAIADRIAGSIEDVCIGGRQASASIGVAVGSATSAWEDILRSADARMYENKRIRRRVSGAIPAPRESPDEWVLGLSDITA